MEENIGFTVPLFVLVLFEFRDTLLVCTGKGSLSELISDFHTLNAVQMQNVTSIFILTALHIFGIVCFFVILCKGSKKD